ncbi:diphosphomevalonate decarboxylase [Galbibacter sp. EGI 63066]|uniref:diphosphomevalonate/mevalonate 3,5-bisphosphate decarboxylase family protein n=1 Tax=Galbibacter sp. EGI 63066 TaxID=2993559 RepID=UPI0022492C40|nr:diphosphomevalonate decarboxylase [Galbibacter sp. EGI 63066]MCX2679917.1 diphosphomevalonate decarboxylase [Galbibacter sp. EGI 63066]
MDAQQFIPNPYIYSVEKGKVSWQSPSNIALVKYWGKKQDQIPTNPSISFTLNDCKTMTSLTFTKKENDGNFSFEVYLDGEKKDSFKPKIETFFKRVESYLPFLKDYHFKIETHNTFPHSSGIASSASGMSALALCLLSVEQQLIDKAVRSVAPVSTKASGVETSGKKASFLARLGSGSACRSIEGSLVEWGTHPEIEGSTDLFGVKYPYEVHEVFQNYQDTILLVDVGEKKVSSTVGHNLMHGHSYAESRFKQAGENLSALKDVFKRGDLDRFVEIVESEALTLHAMMMTSLPYFILIKPNTLQIIEKIWAFRKSTGSKACFTLDAGANVHLLYPETEKDKVLQFVQGELVEHCKDGKYICDSVGLGAQPIIENEE